VLTAGGILALGYALKVTPVAVVVAAVLWFLAAATVERTRRAWTACAVQLAGLTLGLVAGLVITDAAVARLADAPKTTPGVAASAWHYVASGLRVQIGPNGNRVFGGYDRPVNVATSGKPTEVQTQISKDFIRRDLERRGLVGTVLFQVNKLDFTWGDGMLWAYGEGTDLSRKPVHQGQPFELVQSWNSPGGEHFGARVAITQGFWWLVLTLVAFGWLRGRVTAESLLLVLALVGVAGFTLLFQGRSRYLITYVPLLAVAAVWWWRDLGAVRPRRGGAAIDAPTPEQEREPQVV
jgi:hypothetical protein